MQPARPRERLEQAEARADHERDGRKVDVGEDEAVLAARPRDPIIAPRPSRT